MSKGLKNHFTEPAKENELKMMLNKKEYKHRIFVLLEGQTDIYFFRKLLNREGIKLECFDGKEHVKHIVKSLTKEHPDRIVGICDADFDHLNQVPQEQSVFLTDTHDSETMVLQSVGVDALIAEYVSEDYQDGISRNMLTESLQASYEIGLLKWVNSKESLNLRFKELDFNRFITINKLQVQFCQKAFIQAVLQNSRENSVTLESVTEKVELYREEQADKYMVCSGHDITKIMALILQSKNGLTNAEMHQNKIEEALRLSYNKINFAQTSLYNNLLSWQNEQNQKGAVVETDANY